MKISAQYLKVGLLLGILKASDAQLWVNEQISIEDEPSETLIELAYVGHNVHELVSLLSEFRPETDDYNIVKQLLGDIKTEDLIDIQFCYRLAKNLFNFYVEKNYEAPDELSGIEFFDDEYYLAKLGVYGDLDSWHSEFKDFIETFKTS